mmetsp:Transcript_96568/g.268419  ORF Transcript_96568/g.268419 Transcript_96568/m.268419 type:complete len:214 (+) Transcript_96568:48-689(+)|eukprot:CAMPEP_0179090938 /NCGR_PEP_ID=MMETSP0796-20121207/41513_1 /TAXON_ID=73915 /ORGANISM="Pyrodinium bahamense, Strain pbaha01" /LENGTH=213 /DNA_ID=CAMNT_0020788515 /DNA_START=9 /DNA_END=650 /DNA_ORIENTATION=+
MVTTHPARLVAVLSAAWACSVTGVRELKPLDRWRGAAQAWWESECGLKAICPGFDWKRDCRTCDLKLNNFSWLPTEEENAHRNDFNKCAVGDLLPLKELRGSDFDLQHMFKASYYVDTADCSCWRRMSVVTSVFHKPLLNYKFVHLHRDCSSSELEIPRHEPGVCGRLDTSNQVIGSFNFFDPDFSKEKHTSADVVPAGLHGGKNAYVRTRCD